jgi:glutaryl-CoA dehydrogenase
MPSQEFLQKHHPLPTLKSEDKKMSTNTEMTDYMNIQGLLTDEEKLVRTTARQFVNDEVLPIIEEHALNETFPSHLVPKMGEMGFFGPSLPEKYGCAGLSNVAYGLLMYELERGYQY